MPRKPKSKLSRRKVNLRGKVLGTVTANDVPCETVLLEPSVSGMSIPKKKKRDNDVLDLDDAHAAGPSRDSGLLRHSVAGGVVYSHGSVNIPNEPVFDVGTSDIEDIATSPLLPIPYDVGEMLLDFGNDLESERLQQVELARERDAEERRLLVEAIEEARDRNLQIATYLKATILDDDLQPFALGAFNEVCRHCCAIFFKLEKTTRNEYTSCCSNGAIELPPLEATPPLLRRLYTGDHRLSRHFKGNLVRLNYVFQFASVEAKMREFSNTGPYIYAIQGKVYHHVAHVDINNTEPRYAQMYFLDPENGLARRAAEFGEGLNMQLLQELEGLLRRINPYAMGYVHLRERYEIEKECLSAADMQMPNLVLEIMPVYARENRNFDLPAVPEVAVVYNADDGLLPTRNMRVYLRNRPNRFIEIQYGNPLSDPLSFPLLFPTGQQGWHYNIFRNNNRTKISLADYYNYRFAYRTMADEHFQIFQYSGKLFQQYVVISYIKIESSRLKYISENQNLFRVELYNGLADYLRTHADHDGLHLGRMIILPSTFIGGPRNMMELFQDSLAIVQRLGHPSLFITMTCNPKWPEIINNIPVGDEATNHPFLVSRVFKMKLKELLDDLDKKQVMGISLGRLFVIEFQKRGLPHAHILVILRPEDRMEESFRIDSLIRAELPDAETEPNLYRLICTHNIHGPCYSGSVCMVDGKCSKHFPKPFVGETTIDNKGFVRYKRRDDGRIAIIRRNGKEVRMDNRWVVPYNPYLTLKYSCHINIEACPSTRAVKYLYKYVWKGADKCLVRIRAQEQVEYNEIDAYLAARYLAAPEATWRIQKFELHGSTHAVKRLPVHLPEEQMVIFQPANVQLALGRYEHTHLTRWFELNQHDANARQYLYSEIPVHYVWKSSTRNWSPRQRGGDKIISRMYSVSPRQGELYYLRLLLLHVRGPQNWDDIRTVEGHVCQNFREACSRLHLLLDDAEWVRCLTEAQQVHMSYQMRQLFACILVFCEVADPVQLWQRFGDSMTDDYMHEDANLRGDVALQMALIDLQRTLSIHNKRLGEYGLPQPNVNLITEDIIDVEAERQEGLYNLNVLNHEQRFIFDNVMHAIERNRLEVLPALSRLFVVNSPGGTGKSFLFNTLISTLAGDNISVISCCFSGIGAIILKRGRTIHSTFKLKLNPDERSTSGIRPNSQEGRYIAGAELIIIDEISMVSKAIFDIIDKALRDITRCNECFGGKVVLLGGDFRQLLPVIEHADRCTVVANCVKNSIHWLSFTQYVLNINMRVLPAEVEFSEWLMQLGNNTLPTFNKTMAGNLIRIPECCVVDSKEQLIEVCFEGIAPGDYRNIAILAPRNDDCDYINEQVLNKIEGAVKTYYSADILDDRDEETLAANYTVEFLNALKPSGFAQHRLCLKVGTVVLLLRNLNVKKNLCNGTKLLIRELHNNFISAERLDLGRLTGEIVFIPRIDFSTVGSTFPISFKRRQYPVRLAYSMTINKSQGQTLDSVGIFLPKAAFSHGALYVAASRAKSFDRLHVFVEDGNEQGKVAGSPGIYTKNIVYTEVLL